MIDKRTGPLYRYAFEAGATGSPVMQDVAKAALIHGHTQESLAKALDLAQPSTVMRHFTKGKPRQGTIDAYVDLLKMDKQHVRMLQGRPLNADDERDAWNVIRAIFENKDFDYTTGVLKRVTKSIQSLSELQRYDLMRQVLLENHRWQFREHLEGANDAENLLYMIDSITAILRPNFEVFYSKPERRNPKPSLLCDLYNLLIRDHNLPPKDVEKWFLPQVRLYSEIHELDFASMERSLKTQLEKERAALTKTSPARKKTRFLRPRYSGRRKNQ